jgi:hypothetical protein
MAARLTEAEARALGITVKAGRTRTTRRTAKGPYWTRCVTCGTVFETAASEDRHVAETDHRRFEGPIV